MVNSKLLSTRWHVISLSRALLILCLAFLHFQSVQSQNNRPNIVFIFVDDQGYYDLGCYGATEVKTPHVDALAQKGIRFTDYYAAAPICSPSRVGLLTGCYPRRTGNGVWVHRPDSDTGIPASRLTIAELFKDEGYATACIGKWHVGFSEPYLPKNKGFDHYFGLMHNLDDFEVVHYEEEGGMPLMRNGEVVLRKPEPGSLTKLYTEEAITWIEECTTKGESEQPFFLYLPHTMLHHPLGVSPEFEGSSKLGLYGDAVQELDFYVGNILDVLVRVGIDDNTIIVYTSDNGRQGGRNEQQPIRGSKLTSYEGGLRVPCIAYWPGVIEEGISSSVLAHSMDWYPTLASLAGITVPEGILLDGRDLSPLLLGKTDKIPAFNSTSSLNGTIPYRREFRLDHEWKEIFTQEEYINAFFYHGSHGALSAVRSGKWKLWLHPELKLFDLEQDPGEHKPVNNWEIKTKLRGMVIQFQREMTTKNN